MPNVATVLWLDEQYSSELFVRDAIGDSYLGHHNALFGRCRALTRSAGFSLMDDDSELAKGYAAAPLLMLDEIYVSKRIPYRANRLALVHLARKSPCVSLAEKDLYTLCHKNVVFHESLHCIGATQISGVLDKALICDPSVRFVVQSAFVEAFANAIERLAFHEADVPLHLMFLRMNSYLLFSRLETELLRDVVSHFGLANTFRMAIVVLCLLNLRSLDPTARDFSMIAEYVCHNTHLSIAEIRFFSESSPKLWGLSRSFRDDTSACFYKLHGHEQAYLFLLGQSGFSDPCTLELMVAWADALLPVFSIAGSGI